MSSQPFRFLDLPTELRYMVYDELTASEYRATLPYMSYKYAQENKKPGIVSVRSGLPVSLLATCKFINNEARPWFEKELEKMKGEPMRLEVTPSVPILEEFLWFLQDHAENIKHGKAPSDYFGRKVQLLRDSAASNPQRIDLEVLMVGDVNNWVNGPMERTWHAVYEFVLRLDFAIVFKGRVTQDSTVEARDEWEQLRYEAWAMTTDTRPLLRLEEMDDDDEIGGSALQG
jgi:hypothetical protein